MANDQQDASVEGDDVVVAIPSDTIQLGQDSDGLPRTDPTPEPKRRSAPKTDDDKVRRERESLQRERDEASARAQRAEAAAAEALAQRDQAASLLTTRTGQALRSHAARVTSDYQQITNAIDSEKNRSEMATREYTRALESGDHTAAAEAQRIIARSEAAIAQLETGRLAAEGEVRQAHDMLKQENTAPAPMSPAISYQSPNSRTEPQAPASPDAWIDQARGVIGSDGAEWLRDHKEFVTDPKLNRKMLRFAEEYADDNGQGSLTSADFARALNEKFFPDDADDAGNDRQQRAVADDEPKAQQRRTTAAPVSRGNGQYYSSRNPTANQVRLPPQLAKFVRESGLNPTEYALGVVSDIKAGKLPKNFLDPDYDHGV